jgi:NADPH2:quinone reductase
MAREANVLGMVLFNMTFEEKRATHAALVAGLESGVLRPVIDREFPLADAPQAHEAVSQGDSHGKIVLVP